jgi:hypothetical protein
MLSALRCARQCDASDWEAYFNPRHRRHRRLLHPKGGIVVTYSARVRMTVYSQDGSRKVVRERSGGHRGFGPTVGQAVEDCIKAAETDATKRAFVTFGNIFGLALYDREQRNVGTPERRQVAAPSASSMAATDEGFEPSEPWRQPTTSRRAIAAAPRPASVGPSRKDHSRLPY